jgi:ATP synthase protein I
MAAGFQMASEFAAAIIVGAAIGYGLDYLTGMSPLFLLVFVLLGFAAGVMNLLRTYKRVQGDIDRTSGSGIGKDLPAKADDEDDDK